ncbi:MAG: alpha/beta hydrolase [Ardenticatenaceae bacterium]|nr:alpha/beta hydrolase [Ardenticatenaceae bacterium]MCB8991395.1 alpha/beta hydrolase [Ardenticatenaceae bacterium]MCB9003825.1 alpha/beta hydrolase [Ardenticatenaceae bacterium]
MPTIMIHDDSIFYTQQGGGDGPALLLIHGAGGSHLDWPAGLRRLDDTAVYTLDLPGHGRSTGNGRHSINGYADVVADFMAAMGLGRVVLAGHSMGGAIAQALVLRQLPAVVGLILLATGARLPVSEAILQQAIGDFDAATAFVAKYAWARHVPDAVRQAGLARLRQTAPAVLHGDFVACNTFDVREQLPEIAVPTLIIAAAEDKMAPPKFSEFLAAGIPQAQLVLLADTGHMLTLEREGEVETAVQTFMREIGG